MNIFSFLRNYWDIVLVYLFASISGLSTSWCAITVSSSLKGACVLILIIGFLVGLMFSIEATIRISFKEDKRGIILLIPFWMVTVYLLTIIYL